MTFLRICFCAVLSALCFLSARGQGDARASLFSFGVIADVQYADADRSGKRDYRGSPARLEKCVEIFNGHELKFIVHAGDLIDRDYASFALPLSIFRKSVAPVHYVIGNHEFSVADSLKGSVRALINNERGYYAFVVEKMQFILVDALDISPHASLPGSSDHRKASKILASLSSKGSNNAFEWNGAMGRRQLRWLKKKLRGGEKRGYKSVLFSHLPLLPENGLQLWNNQEVLALLNSFPSVVAFLSGHHHEGGYLKAGHIHHLTLKGLVEAEAEGSCGVVDVFSDKLVVDGFGDQPDYVLEY